MDLRGDPDNPLEPCFECNLEALLPDGLPLTVETAHHQEPPRSSLVLLSGDVDTRLQVSPNKLVEAPPEAVVEVAIEYGEIFEPEEDQVHGLSLTMDRPPRMFGVGPCYFAVVARLRRGAGGTKLDLDAPAGRPEDVAPAGPCVLEEKISTQRRKMPTADRHADPQGPCSRGRGYAVVGLGEEEKADTRSAAEDGGEPEEGHTLHREKNFFGFAQ